MTKRIENSISFECKSCRNFWHFSNWNWFFFLFLQRKIKKSKCREDDTRCKNEKQIRKQSSHGEMNVSHTRTVVTTSTWLFLVRFPVVHTRMHRMQRLLVVQRGTRWLTGERRHSQLLTLLCMHIAPVQRTQEKKSTLSISAVAVAKVTSMQNNARMQEIKMHKSYQNWKRRKMDEKNNKQNKSNNNNSRNCTQKIRSWKLNLLALS